MTLDELINKLSEHIVNPIILLLLSLAFLVFIWGVFRYVAKGDDAAKRKEGGLAIIFGIIGMFIMFSAFGIMNLIGETVKTLGN